MYKTTLMIVQVICNIFLLYISTNTVAIIQPHPNKGTCSATDPNSFPVLTGTSYVSNEVGFLFPLVLEELGYSPGRIYLIHLGLYHRLLGTYDKLADSRSVNC